MSCYLIKSKLNGLVLDVMKENQSAGAAVVTWHENGNPNQLWYDDDETGTIRSKLNDFCLDLDSDMLVCRPYEEESYTQKWVRTNAFIESRNNKQKVLDIYGEKKAPGAKVGAYKFHGGLNQQWDFVMVPSAPPHTASQIIQEASGGLYPSDALKNLEKSAQGDSRSEFWIVSEFNDKVVDICREDASEDAKVILYQLNPKPHVKNQLWYLDDEGYIRSCLNNFVFISEDKGKPFRMIQYKKNPHCQWTIDGNRIFNRTGECLEVKSKRKEDAQADLVCGQYKGITTQHWIIKYHT